MMSAGSLTTPKFTILGISWRFELQRCHSINTRAKRLAQAMIPRLRKYTPVPRESKKDRESSSADSKCKEMASRISNKPVETASTKLSKGAFQGRNQSCHAKETSNTQSIKASWMPGTSGAHTTDKDKSGPLAKMIKPNHHVEGRKLPMKNPIPRIRSGDAKDHVGANLPSKG